MAGLLAIWIYQQGQLETSAIVGLVLYLALNVAVILILPNTDPDQRRHLAISFYVVDLLFASLLIYHTGGLVSQLFLLYCLLPFKAAIYYPYIHRIIFVSFLIFPLYIVTLFLSTGTLVFMLDSAFLSRYALLLTVVFAGMYTAWHLDKRQQQTRDLLEQLGVEHRQVDQRRRELRAVLDSIVDGVVVVDPELRLLMINPVAADTFDVSYPQPPGTRLEKLVNNQSLINLLRQALQIDQAEEPQLISPQPLAPWMRDAANEALLIDEIKAFPQSSGKPIICQALATALISDQDAPHGAVVVLRDMTRQKELEELKSNFISVLSHELRTPLTTIRGFVELILSGGAGDISRDQRECLDVVFNQTEHLQSLINALLEFAELEAAETRLKLSPLSLEKLVQKVRDQMEAQAADRAVALETQVAPDLAPLKADGARLERVLLNLLDNALKFTPESGHVTLTVQEQDSEVLFCVTDTGPGVPPAERERIFERFYQIDNSSTRAHGGTGLGLATCKHIVELHLGRIWVEEVNNQKAGKNGPGSRFCFTVPRNLTQE